MKIWEEKRLALLNEIETVTTEKAAMETELKQQQETLDKLVKLAEKQKEIDKKYKLISNLWDIARGKDTGINLERFVLGALLDAVTEKANLRLMEMSGSRYELLRKRGERADARKTAGLDLEVYDANTGRTRPAATLPAEKPFLLPFLWLSAWRMWFRNMPAVSIWMPCSLMKVSAVWIPNPLILP